MIPLRRLSSRLFMLTLAVCLVLTMPAIQNAHAAGDGQACEISGGRHSIGARYGIVVAGTCTGPAKENQDAGDSKPNPPTKTVDCGQVVRAADAIGRWDAATCGAPRACSKPDLTAYTLIPALVDINERNVANNESARRSAKFDLAKEDAVPDKDMNEVIWKAVKGESSVMPVPRRSAFVILEAKKKDVDD